MTLYCGFCGKSQHEVTKLVAGPKVHICDECVGLCHDIVQGRELRRPPPREHEPGSFGYHEVLHLAAVFADMVRRHLLDHSAIRHKPAWAELAEKAVEALGERHQAIGAEHLTERPGKPQSQYVWSGPTVNFGEVIGFGEALSSEEPE